LITKIGELVGYALKYNLFVNPKYNYADWAKTVIKLDRCPCDPRRSSCPCPQGHVEAEQTGRCFCNFFIKEDRNA